MKRCGNMFKAVLLKKIKIVFIENKSMFVDFRFGTLKI